MQEIGRSSRLEDTAYAQNRLLKLNTVMACFMLWIEEPLQLYAFYCMLINKLQHMLHTFVDMLVQQNLQLWYTAMIERCYMP